MKYAFIRPIVIFFLGMIAGGVFITIILGGQIDEITHKNQLLNQRLELCQDELNQINKNMGEKGKKVVAGIEPRISIIGENMARLEEKNTILVLDKQVCQWLEPIKGQEVEKLNHLLIPQIIDDRIVEFEGANYHCKVKLVIVDVNIIIYIDAKKEKIARPVNQPVN